MNKTYQKLEREIVRKTKLHKNRPLFLSLLFVKDNTIKAKQKIFGKKMPARFMEDHKAIYFSLTKVASTSLIRIFNKIEKGKMIRLTPKELKLYKDYFKFAFVRNPYDRVVSCYENKINQPWKEGTINGLYEGFLRYKNIYPNIPFKKFVKAISKIPDSKADYHICSQHRFLSTKKGKLMVDYIAKFENLEQEYYKICKKIGVKNIPSLPKKNKTKRKNYKDYYDEETKKLVAKRYKKDFELFNYKF